MKTLKRFSLLLFAVLSLSVTAVQPVSACSGFNAVSLFTIEPWYACLPENDAGDPQVTQLSDLFLIIFPVLEGLIKISIFVAAGYMFWSLYVLMSSQGDPGKRSTAIGGLRDAIVGLVIIIVAVPAINFVAGLFK